MNHDPAVVLEHGLAVLIGANRLDPHDTGLAIAVFLLADDFGDRTHGVSWVDWRKKPHPCVAEVRDRIERDIVDRLSEHDVEGEQVVDRLAWVAQRSSELRRTVEWIARTRQPDVDRRFAFRDGPGHRVHELCADFEILEKIAWIGLGHVISSVAKDRL